MCDGGLGAVESEAVEGCVGIAQQSDGIVECGFAANADFVAACNIREAGLRLLSLSQSSGDVSPSCEDVNLLALRTDS